MSYDDEGSDTLGNIARKLGGLRLPVLAQLGLGCIQEIIGVACPEAPLGCFGRMAEASAGKDTTVGHWEMMGIITDRPFPTYPRGFPDEVIKEFERRIGRKTLGNRAASGTVIIEELGAEHLRTGYPIVYTSADSVFQIAAHEEVIPLEQLYTFSRIARELLQGEWTVDRVIARPFKGSPGQFVRTEGRKDFGLEPPQPTLLDIAKSAGLSVVGVGKIGDIFAHRGLTQEVKTAHNTETMHELLRCVEQAEKGIIFANLIDFDMLYGHRNDVSGFAGALAEFDAYLPRLMAVMQESDALFITADHGCDPTTASTDHSREYVPILCYGLALDQGVDLGTRRTFADLGATVSDLLGLGELPTGESFAEELLGAGSEDVGRRCPVGPSTVC
ncbi:MAG: phosphopentomutase [Anaerolineae bacterium]